MNKYPCQDLKESTLPTELSTTDFDWNIVTRVRMCWQFRTMLECCEMGLKIGHMLWKNYSIGPRYEFYFTTGLTVYFESDKSILHYCFDGQIQQHQMMSNFYDNFGSTDIWYLDKFDWQINWNNKLFMMLIFFNIFYIKIYQT
jgi:hypothetical protein